MHTFHQKISREEQLSFAGWQYSTIVTYSDSPFRNGKDSIYIVNESEFSS
jgi:hypothetical protein